MAGTDQTGRDKRDNGVIELSRFRAALARARKSHRADAILSEPDAAQLVPKLPVQELYYAIQEVGLADAQELVALASPEQVRGLVDLDVWQRGDLDDSRMRPWIDALVAAGPVKLQAAVDGLDPELVALFIQRHARVYDTTLPDDPPPAEPEGHFYPTPDGFFLLDIRAEGEAGKTVERMIDWLYRADPEHSRRWLMAAKWELSSDLEEWSLRWRQGRMSDLGYADYYEALSIYRYLDPGSVRLDEETLKEATPQELEQASSLPVQLASALDEKSLFARALATIRDDAHIERIQSLLMLLINKAMAADLVEPGDVEGARRALERAVGYLGIGLSYLARVDGADEAARAGHALMKVALERIFRLGVSLTLQLRRLADTLVAKGGVQLDHHLLLDAPYDSLVRALRQARPLFDDGSGARPFRSLDDIRRAAALLEEASLIAPYLHRAIGLTRESLTAALDGATLAPFDRSEVRFGTFVRTWSANLLLGHPPTVSPLHPRDLRVLRPLLEAQPGDRIEAALAATGPSPAALHRWLQGWLGDFSQVLVRYSWLK
jgi:hypothetical protein